MKTRLGYTFKGGTYILGRILHAYFRKCRKGSLFYRLCFKYFFQFKIDSETYTYLAAVSKDGDVSK